MISTLDKSVKSSENKARLNQSFGVQEVGTKFFSESSKILLTSGLFPVQSSELRTQNSELRTQSLELGAWSLEFGSWTIDLSGIRKPARNFSTGGFLVGFLRLNPFIIN